VPAKKIFFETCKYCNKNKECAKGYVICFDCLFDLDINHKDYEQYKKSENN